MRWKVDASKESDAWLTASQERRTFSHKDFLNSPHGLESNSSLQPTDKHIDFGPVKPEQRTHLSLPSLLTYGL